MFTASFVIFAFYIKGTVTNEIFTPSVPQDSCLEQILSEVVKDVDSLTISWSRRIDANLKDEISKIFMDKIKFIITDRQFEASSNGHDRNPATVLLVASKTADIHDGIVSLQNKLVWSVMSNFIVLYSDENGNRKKSSPEPFLRKIFRTFANLNALNVRVIYKFNDGVGEFTWFPYEDSNCDSVDRVRLISDCAFGIFKNHSHTLDSNKLRSMCTITAAVRSYEPYSFYSRDSGFSKGVDIDLVKELAHWSHFNVEFKAIDIGDSIEEAMLTEKNFDIIIGSTNGSCEYSAQSIDFHFDDLTWCVRKSDLLQPWRRLFLLGSWQVWTIAVVGVYTTGATLLLFYKHYHHHENYHYCTGVAFMSLFAIPVPYYPTHGIARIHFGIILIYGLLVVILINCYLTSLMTKPHYQYQVHTTDDLIHYEYQILVDADLVSLADLGDDKVSSYTKANFAHCYGMVNCLNQLYDGSRVAVIVPRKFASHFESTTSFPLYCFAKSETFNKVTRTLTFNRSNSYRYLLKKTNLFIRQAVETGHLLKWEANSVGERKYENYWDGPVVLSVEHFGGLIFLYIIFITLALLCLIGERLAFKNIAQNNRGPWKLLDDLLFSTERIVCKNQHTHTVKNRISPQFHGKKKVAV